MTGDDVKKLFDDLGLNPIGASRLVGIELKHFHSLVGYRNLPFGPEVPVPPLPMEILVELWKRVETTYDTSTDKGRAGARAYGVILAKAMHTHGPLYTAWLIADDRCSKIFEEDMLTRPTSSPKVPSSAPKATDGGVATGNGLDRPDTEH